MDANQLDCGKVISSPSPGTLPVRSRRSWKKVGSWRVVVNDLHFDSSMWSVKFAGRPNSGRPAAIFSHSAHEPPLEPGKQKTRSCRTQELVRSSAQENERQKKASSVS
jgi:hypothetical protein